MGRSIRFSVSSGEILCLLGRNGAGKTTALKSIIGILPPRQGRLWLDGEDLSGLAPQMIPRQGIGYVPQGRRLFKELTVRENLEVGLMTRKSGKVALDRALSYFPALHERMNQLSGTLSGGEQTMLAIARRRLALGRPAANVGHQPGAHGQPRSDPVGRTHRGPDAVDDRNNPRCDDPVEK